MRIVCLVEVVHLNSELQGISGPKRKAVRSTISIVQKNREAMLMLCTARNKSGNLYKIARNIQRVFCKMVANGMTTLRLKEPMIDLRISNAARPELERLLKAIKLASQGESLLGHGVLSTCEPVKVKVVKKAQTKMEVRSKADYPLTSGFPSSLQQLTAEVVKAEIVVVGTRVQLQGSEFQVSGCELRKFDSRILRLHHLTHLSLSNNKLDKLPEDIANMRCLSSLDVDSNQITTLPPSLCSRNSRLCSTLKSLTLSNNKIRYLPADMDHLSELVSLRVNGNRLRMLPQGIGHLRHLKYLLARENSILFLPFSVKKLSLLEIDVAQNEFASIERAATVDRLLSVPTLQDLAGSVLLHERIRLDETNSTKQCQNMMLFARNCAVCAKAVFRSYLRILVEYDLRRISETVMYCDRGWGCSAPFDVFVCSKTCFNLFRL